jgi:ATP-binding cassette, subfamily F, member 3
MIQLSAAGKRYGPKILFEGLDWLITPQDRVGIVGANGTGKSTLLKILGSIESLDYGSISRAKSISAGYLPQDGLSLSGRTVMEECMSVFADLHAAERELEQLSHAMGELDPTGPEFAAVADRFHELQNELTRRDAYTLESQVGIVLSGLGFKKDDWSRRTEEFSGGWQMRLALAKLLLEKPNLLLLDEPTNHLDLETRNWLEQYLTSYPYAYVLISHDRYFLDVTVNRIVEIWNKQVHFYPGNYEKYLAQKQQRQEQLESAYRNQRERIEQLEAFINRFRYQATKAKQVQSRIKELEKIERIEIPPNEKPIHFSFPQPMASGRTVAEFIGVKKVYGARKPVGDREIVWDRSLTRPDHDNSAVAGTNAERETENGERRTANAATVEVFSNASFTIERGDRVALVGPNGAGKSTLIKILSAMEQPTAGEFRLGHNVQPDYFAQDQYKQFDPEARVLDDIWAMAPGRNQTEMRTLLGCFLFSDEDVFKQIGVLSGGERSRYALARMLLRPSNFLLLDEPTNHLDLRAKDVLLRALQDYTGTIVFVSHDRYFIDRLATRVFEIGNGRVVPYTGNYEDYLWQKQKENEGRVDQAASVRVRVNENTGDRFYSADGRASSVQSQDGKADNGNAGFSATPSRVAAADNSPGRKSGESVTLATESRRDGREAPRRDDTSDAQPAPEKKRINPIKLRQMRDRCTQIEEDITRVETEISETENALAVFVSPEETARLTKLLAGRREELESLMFEWEELSQTLEANT